VLALTRQNIFQNGPVVFVLYRFKVFHFIVGVTGIVPLYHLELLQLLKMLAIAPLFF
jgi:hypothetical protein